jgi:hypothetical protein
MDDDREHTARSRQLARLPAGKKPPGPRAALAMAKSKAYQAAADAPATLPAYETDLENFKAWCQAHGFEPMPAAQRRSEPISQRRGSATPCQRYAGGWRPSPARTE